MRQLKYGVYGVDRAGTPWTAAEMDDPMLALSVLRLLQEKEKANPRVDRVYGVYENYEPEKGDVQGELEELEYEKAQAGRCVWCGRLDADGHDMEAHNAAP